MNRSRFDSAIGKSEDEPIRIDSQSYDMKDPLLRKHLIESGALNSKDVQFETQKNQANQE